MIESEDSKSHGKADKFCYWLQDYINFLERESNVRTNWHRYKRGQIIKVHLGYNVGSEEGGLHYAVVLNNNDNRHNSILNIVPLTSVKPQTDLDNLRPGSVYLGNEIFTNLIVKHSATEKFLLNEKDYIKETLDYVKHGVSINIKELEKRLNEIDKKLFLLKSLKKEISKMKIGSIALIDQITTISKLRIYNPRNNYDVLHGVKLSTEKLNIIDNTIKKLYTK